MSIFYPDNANRRNRVYQLVNESSTYLTNAHTNFAILQNQLAQLNTEVDAAYKAIHASPPGTATIDISQGLEDIIGPINSKDTLMEIATCFIDIGWLGVTIYLQPVAVRILVKNKTISKEFGSKIILKSVSPFWDRFSKTGAEGIQITWAEILGSLVAETAAGVPIVSIDSELILYEESEQRDKLREGIQEFLRMRLTMKLADAKFSALLMSIQSISNMLVVMDNPTEDQLNSLITKVVTKAQAQVDAINENYY